MTKLQSSVVTVLCEKSVTSMWTGARPVTKRSDKVDFVKLMCIIVFFPLDRRPLIKF